MTKADTKEKEVTVFVRELKPISLAVKDLAVISSPEQQEEAGKLLTLIKGKYKRVTDHKETLTKPLNAALKAWRGVFKPVEEQYEEHIAVLRSAMSSYQTEQDRLAREKADKIAARVGEGRGHLHAETAENQIATLDKPAAVLESSTGTVKFRDEKKFEITDIQKLCAHDIFRTDLIALCDQKGLIDQLVRQYMKAGKELEGVRYWTEKSPISSVY